VRRAVIANLGCKVNQSEMDSVVRLLRARGVELVHGDADLVVVNTCTVTSMADRKSRQIVRRARRENPGARVFVTGCSVAIDPDSLASADPAARLLDNDAKGTLLGEVAGLLGLPDGAQPTLSGVESAEPAAAEPGPAWAESSGEESGDGPAVADRTRAFVKIQDGCSFHCTYCIIPRARGAERSVAADAVLADVRAALAAGRREVVLTGINAGTYRDGELGLPGLIRRILAETPIERIRLSSIEPQHVTDELLSVWVESGGRCLPHFHVPLQSGDDSILRRMGRRYDTAAYAEVVERVRRAIPGAAVHADLIAGFPGEDEESWSRTLAFVGGLSLAGVHVFRFSGRPGTPAVRMVGQVDGVTKKRRAAQMLALAADARAATARAQLGRELRALFEQPAGGGRWLGHADNYVAVLATATAGEPLANRIGLVRVDSIDPDAPDRVVGRLLSFG
jgi:threonylcarbamoyladenosine tRNA methylthiotransferase MtaB